MRTARQSMEDHAGQAGWTSGSSVDPGSVLGPPRLEG